MMSLGYLCFQGYGGRFGVEVDDGLEDFFHISLCTCTVLIGFSNELPTWPLRFLNT